MMHKVIQEMDELLEKHSIQKLNPLNQIDTRDDLISQLRIWRDMLAPKDLEHLAHSQIAKLLYEDLIFIAYKSNSKYEWPWSKKKVVKPDDVYTMAIHKRAITEIHRLFLDFHNSGENLTEKKLVEMTEQAYNIITQDLWAGYPTDFYEEEVDGCSWGQGIYDSISGYCMDLAAHLLCIRHDEGDLY